MIVDVPSLGPNDYDMCHVPCPYMFVAPLIIIMAGSHEAEETRVTERRETIQEQVMAARENRSVVFNPRDGKVEQIEIPKKWIFF